MALIYSYKVSYRCIDIDLQCAVMQHVEYANVERGKTPQAVQSLGVKPGGTRGLLATTFLRIHSR